VKVHSTRVRASQDEAAVKFLQLALEDFVAPVRLFFITFESVFVLLGVVVSEPIYLSCNRLALRSLQLSY
jgi:hypothetical protein